VIKISELEKGEIDRLLKDLRKEGEIMMQDLIGVDEQLVALKSSIESGNIDKEELLEKINDIRQRIGTLEEEDKRELNEEDIATNLIAKLRKWVDAIA
jgi:chromosome segregation ATPase